MAQGSDAFDGILLSIATQHEGGVQDVNFDYFSNISIKAFPVM